MITSATPASRNWFSRWSITVPSPTGIKALGRTVEYGARRVPRPPAWMTAFSSATTSLPPIDWAITLLRMRTTPSIARRRRCVSTSRNGISSASAVEQYRQTEHDRDGREKAPHGVGQVVVARDGHRESHDEAGGTRHGDEQADGPPPPEVEHADRQQRDDE